MKTFEKIIASIVGLQFVVDWARYAFLKGSFEQFIVTGLGTIIVLQIINIDLTNELIKLTWKRIRKRRWPIRL
jgi:hypothetical protein